MVLSCKIAIIINFILILSGCVGYYTINSTFAVVKLRAMSFEL